MSLITRIEAGQVPDTIARKGMQLLNHKRLWDEGRYSRNKRVVRQRDFLASLREGPIAVSTSEANAQHYEVPPEFFVAVLGEHLKYSCCWFESPDSSLDEAEAAMLQLTCERAGLPKFANQEIDVLDLGCGWGSFSLYAAQKFPRANFTAVSNSNPQREFIEARRDERGLTNLNVITADINEFDTTARFDRIVSIEMFEHMSNYEALLTKVSSWLRDETSRALVHYFCHKDLAYPFIPVGQTNWMAKYFFTGGIMPSFGLFDHFNTLVRVDQRWWVSGEHYEHTSNAWLAQLDAQRDELLAVMATTYGAAEAAVWLQRWRMFFMAVAELFGTDRGREWGVGHYLLAKA